MDLNLKKINIVYFLCLLFLISASAIPSWLDHHHLSIPGIKYVLTYMFMNSTTTKIVSVCLLYQWDDSETVRWFKAYAAVIKKEARSADGHITVTDTFMENIWGIVQCSLIYTPVKTCQISRYLYLNTYIMSESHYCDIKPHKLTRPWGKMG